MTDAPEKRAVVAFCARLIPRKNGVLFSHAMKSCLADFPSLQVEIIGDGPDESAMREILKTELQAGRVNIARSADPFSRLLPSAIFVSLIEPDNYPSQAVLEAMNCEAFLVLSNTGDSARFIQGGNGVLVDLDVTSIAAAISDRLSNLPETVRMGQRNTKVLAEHFSERQYLDFLLDIYAFGKQHPRHERQS
ncbi:MAG: glycosyltransferase [Burkholderiales bacterium]|nr:MAG: glycosyltransferase [Burkholderiales bacterium]